MPVHPVTSRRAEAIQSGTVRPRDPGRRARAWRAAWPACALAIGLRNRRGLLAGRLFPVLERAQRATIRAFALWPKGLAKRRKHSGQDVVSNVMREPCPKSILCTRTIVNVHDLST